MGSPSTLFIAVIAGAFGAGYFVYGKKEGRLVPMLAGAALCIYPYFIDNVLVLCLVGLALLAAPFVIDL